MVELAIVLVIIGLLVGGVLVGQDLIKAAEIRTVTAQIHQYDSAALTFRSKYGGLPGDLISSKASTFGFTARNGNYGAGNGDGLIVSGAVGNARRACCEPIWFWTDLSDAKLIPGSYIGDGGSLSMANFTVPADFAPYIPHLKIRDYTYVHVVPYMGRNQYILWQMTNTSNGGTISYGNGLSVYEASVIDEKLDDGLPASGNVKTAAGVGVAMATLDSGGAIGQSRCTINTTTPYSYNTTNSTYRNNINCQLIIRTAF